jgi:hypothetical protein
MPYEWNSRRLFRILHRFRDHYDSAQCLQWSLALGHTVTTASIKPIKLPVVIMGYIQSDHTYSIY